MDTVYDGVTVVLFCIIIALYFYNQNRREQQILLYVGAGAACGLANWVGNNGYGLGALLIVLGIGVYIYHYLWPRA